MNQPLTGTGSDADTGSVAAEDTPDFDAFALERVQLAHRQREMLRQHDKVLERIAGFPNEFERARAAAIAAALEEIADRIEVIDAQILPYRLHDE